jgi:hypothetical protein
MAAGQGFKTFTTGEVLTAGDVNGYLMQGVLVFASAAARDAAITSPQEGQFAFTKDTNGLWYYDGAAWVASGATGDIEGVTAGVGISGGGTSGTVTVTNSMATAIDAKGDLVVGTGADTFAKLTVGANGTTLVADSSESTGLKWQTSASSSPASAQTTVSTYESTSSTSYTGFTTATAVTLTTGTKALVFIGCEQMNNNAAEEATYLSFAVSGATTSAATDLRAMTLVTSTTGNRPKIGGSRAFLMTGLTAGSNTFTMQVKVSTSSSGGAQNRSVTVIDMGS